MTVAMFDHRTSRAGDPQLHTDALVLNKVRCADGGWRTVDGAEVFRHKKSAGMLYQAGLRAELTRRLGVTFTAVSEHGQAEIAGIPAELIAAWSTRTGQIKADAGQALGREPTGAERARIVKTSVLATRPPKEHRPRRRCTTGGPHRPSSMAGPVRACWPLPVRQRSVPPPATQRRAPTRPCGRHGWPIER